jgi:asparagine synthase (glutamine-hydrolysing)
MIYPDVSLTGGHNHFNYAEFPLDPEKGSFLEVREGPDHVSIRVDRFSTLPFYYLVIDRQIYGATHLSRLLESLPAGTHLSLNAEAAIQLVRTNTMFGEGTLFAEIRRVPYGHRLEFERSTGRLTLTAYWQLPQGFCGSTGPELVGRLREAFFVALADHLESADRVGMHLSGGMDSRQILAACLRLGRPPVCFTYGLPGTLDMEVAGKLAARFGLEHWVFPWEDLAGFRDQSETQFALTDGMQSLFDGHGLDVYPQEAGIVERTLYGHFLDFFLQGHTYDPHFDTERGPFTRARLYACFDGGPCSIMRGDALEPLMLRPAWRGVFRESLTCEIGKFDGYAPEKRYDALYLVHHGLRRLLPQVQAGAHALDFRLPGLHREFFELAWSVPGPLRRDRGLQRQLIESLYPATLDSPMVFGNHDLRYMSGSRIRRAGARLRDRWAARFSANEPLRDYYGKELKVLAESTLYPWMRAEILKARPALSALFEERFLDAALPPDRFNPDLGVTFYGALFTLARFLLRYEPKLP